MAADGPAAAARFTLSAGEDAWFVLQPGGCGERWSDEAVARASSRRTATGAAG